MGKVTNLDTYLAQVAERARSVYFDTTSPLIRDEIPNLLRIIAEMRGALEDVSKEQTYVESQSTGMRQYFNTGASRKAEEALAKADAIAKEE